MLIVEAISLVEPSLLYTEDFLRAVGDANVTSVFLRKEDELPPLIRSLEVKTVVAC